MKPTPPIPIAGGAEHARAVIEAPQVDVSDASLARLRSACAAVSVDPAERAEASRDWWPLAMTWALDGAVPARAGAVVRPETSDEVAEVLRVCNADRLPVTTAGGRSGVCGASVPVHGGVVLDLTGLAGIIDVDDTSLLLDVAAGTFGQVLEDDLQVEHGLTLGHWPQSIELSTVGGWLGCRSAGQFSTRYGTIADMVVGLDVVLADGTRVTTGGTPRQAVGPDLSQVFLGSEGTLGVFTSARLRVHPQPEHTLSSAYGLRSFVEGLEVCRRLLRRGATPAVLRLYDATEADRSYQTGDRHVLLVRDEGEPTLVANTMAAVDDEARTAQAEPLDVGLVERWLEHRNDVSALQALITAGYVLDTMEISGPWAALPRIYEATLAALLGVEGTLAASAHCSHSYLDGGCLYFTFGGQVDPDRKDAYYRALWDAGTSAVLEQGGSLSHHHGVGLNRARFVRNALGPAFGVLEALKRALDPQGILNPGKLGLPSPFGEVAWP